jgi:putative pyruvate formate lyase activating enzyme
VWAPGYLKLHKTGELALRWRALDDMLKSCSLCPRACGADRTAGKEGACSSGVLPVVSSYCAHFGEEPALVGRHGVGNIFLGNCNLRCVYCQNFEISQRPDVERHHAASCERLAGIMLDLQGLSCGSVGFVSPTHFVPQIMRAVDIAVPLGLRLPLIYNSNGYDNVDALKLLEGVTEIYLPDLRYASDETGLKYSGVRDYTAHARGSIKEMHRQVGPALLIEEDGLVKRGLVIRLLVLPNGISETEESLRWIAYELGTQVTISVMAQYYPANEAFRYPELARGLKREEYQKVLDTIEELGFENGWIQRFASRDYYRPDFGDRREPFRRQRK